MGDFNGEERKAVGFLKKHDFSRFGKAHNEKLWQSLNPQSAARRLSDDELDLIAAAGAEQPPKEPEEPGKP